MDEFFVFLLRGEIKEYLPPQEEVRRNIEEIYTFCVGQVAAIHSLTPQETKIKFIGEWYLPNHITDVGNDDDSNVLTSSFCHLLSFRDSDHPASLWRQHFLGSEGEPARLSISMYGQHQPGGGAVYSPYDTGNLWRLQCVPLRILKTLAPDG